MPEKKRLKNLVNLQTFAYSAFIVLLSSLNANIHISKNSKLKVKYSEILPGYNK